MYTIVLLAVLGILLGIVLMQLFKKQPETSQAVPDLANLTVTDARAGDALSISGAGDNYTDLDFTAERMTRFNAGNRNWFEVSGSYRNRRVILRVASDEDLDVSLCDGKDSLTLNDLALAEEDLAEMDDRQNVDDNFEFHGKSWLYRLSREVHATRSDQAAPIGFYYWEFREQGGKDLIAIRKPEGEPFAVTRYAAIHPTDVTVYRGRLTT